MPLREGNVCIQAGLNRPKHGSLPRHGSFLIGGLNRLVPVGGSVYGMFYSMYQKRIEFSVMNELKTKNDN